MTGSGMQNERPTLLDFRGRNLSHGSGAGSPISAWLPGPFLGLELMTSKWQAWEPKAFLIDWKISSALHENFIFNLFIKLIFYLIVLWGISFTGIMQENIITKNHRVEPTGGIRPTICLQECNTIRDEQQLFQNNSLLLIVEVDCLNVETVPLG